MPLSIHQLSVGQMAENCYLIINSKSNAVIIDPGDSPDYISDRLTALGGRPQAVIATHGHFDHIMAAFALQTMYSIPFYIHAKDTFLLLRMVESAKRFLNMTYVDPPPQEYNEITEGALKLDEFEFRILHVPGHTPGGIALYEAENNCLFVGDVIFADGSKGRTDFSYSDAHVLVQSLKKFEQFNDKTIVYPGHGSLCTIADIKKYL